MSLAVKVRDRSEMRESRWRLTLPELWAFVSVSLPIVVTLASRMSTVDLAYHVRAGSEMLDRHAIPRIDTYTFTAAGQPWLDQQWGAQILLAVVYRAGRWVSLGLLHGALVGGIFAFVYGACRAAGATRRRAAGLTIASFAIAAPGLALRPQLFAMLLFTAVVWIVAERRQDRRLLFLVPVLAALWANVHGSFFFAPVLLLFAWFQDRRSDPDLGRTELVTAAVSAAATVISPFGVRVWSYAYEIATNRTISRFVTEWQPPTLHTYAGIAFYLSVIAVVALLARRSHMVSWAALIPLGVFFVLAVDAQRAIPWWAFAVPPILAGVFRDSARIRSGDDRRSLVSTAFAILLVGLALFFAPWWRSTPPAGGDPGLLTAAPPGITHALAGIVQPGDRIFDAQSWGSWLEFQYRQEHVAVDSRIELFPEHVWDQYLDVSEGRANWQQILDDWNVDIVVASQSQQGKLLPFIRKDPTWHVAYQDDVGAIFTRAS